MIRFMEYQDALAVNEKTDDRMLVDEPGSRETACEVEQTLETRCPALRKIESMQLTPASEGQRAETLHLILQAVRQLRYLTVVLASSQGGKREMLTIRVAPRLKFSGDAMRADMIRLWDQEISRLCETLYHVYDEPDGIAIRFVFVREGQFVTGVVDLSY